MDEVMMKNKDNDKPFELALDKDNERAVRIYQEFLRTKDLFEKSEIENTIVMFGSARMKPDDKHGYYAACCTLAQKLAEWSKEKFKDMPKKDKYYIATGGGGGIMEAANKGAHLAGERTVGLNIQLPF